MTISISKEGMSHKVDTNRYLNFVDGVTSQPSKDTEAMIYRLQELSGNGAQPERLMTAAVGLCAESGEFTEIVKKIVFQGKPYTEENVFHMKRELGGRCMLVSCSSMYCS